MKKFLSLAIIISIFFTLSGFALSRNDMDLPTGIKVNNADYLASKKIIKYWDDINNYRFDDSIIRSEIMGMSLAMAGITRNTTCRGDFADVTKSQTDWVCRTIETAADHGFINAQKEKPKNQRKARPYDPITRAEALAILLKTYPSSGGWAGYSYYWSSSLPTDESTTGYKDIFPFGAEWQASVFYRYIREILQDDTQLHIDPRASIIATRAEVFEFAYTIYKFSLPSQNSDFITYNNSTIKASFSYPKTWTKTGDAIFMKFTSGLNWYRIDLKDNSTTESPALRFEINPDGYGPFFPNKTYTLQETTDGKISVQNITENTGEYIDTNSFTIMASLVAKNGNTYFWIFNSKSETSENMFKEILSTVQLSK